MQIFDCGVADYRQILDLQKRLLAERQQDNIENTILMVEHPAVITLGARESRNNLLLNREDLARRNIDLVNVRRGGGVTAHNLGQLIFYPILNLQQLGLGISEYIRALEEIGSKLLQHLNVHSISRKGFPGLWVGEKKIASIGVRVSKFVTYHGMAINIRNDLGIFDLIIPCGLRNIQMTSVRKETGKSHTMTSIKKKLAELLTIQFYLEKE
jgi:lipoate-protein ligase B